MAGRPPADVPSRSVKARLPALAVALCAACDRGGAPTVWVGLRDAPQVLSVDPSGGRATVVAEPPVIDAPARALALRRDGAVVVLQEPEVCAGGTLDLSLDACVPASATRRAVPPALLLSPFGGRLASFAGADPGGAPLFTVAAPPWAAAEDAVGRVWVTGRTAPVLYGPDGELAGAAEPLPFPTRGVAPLADGRVVVSYGVQDLAVYDPTGAVTVRIEPALGPEYEGIDALAAEPGGTLLLATRRFGVTSAGVVLRARIEGGALVLAQDAAASAALAGGLPSALSLAAGRIATAPPLGRLAEPACARWLSADLRLDLGCVVPGPHRGVAWLK